MSDKVVHVGDADFDSAVLNSKEPVLVDFWAEWCGPCKMIAPALDELADAYNGRAKIAKVNVDQNRALAAKYHVRSIPMLLVFKDGQVQAQQIGAVARPSWPACWTRRWPDRSRQSAPAGCPRALPRMNDPAPPGLRTAASRC